jgi:hypothetical protein
MVSSNGSRGMARRRGHGKELLFLGIDGAVMSVDVTSNPGFRAGAPRKLLQLPLAILSATTNPGARMDVTRDGQRFLLQVPVQDRAQQQLPVVLNWPALIRN